MKIRIGLLAFLLMISAVCFGASPSYSNFNTNDFSTNTVISGQISIRTIIPTSAWIANLGYELWYEPFQGGDIASGTIGSLGWQTQSSGVGGGSCNLSNAVGHFGTVAISTSASANSIQTLFNSDTANTKPTIPPLNAATGWTNFIVWRLNGTNDCKVYMVLYGNANFTQSALEQAMGFFINTTNTPQIMGTTSQGSSVSTTNLGIIVSGVWHTNIMWSATSGVISFAMDGGPEATLSANLPTSSLTPGMSVIKTLGSAAVSLEMDNWMIITAR